MSFSSLSLFHCLLAFSVCLSTSLSLSLCLYCSLFKHSSPPPLPVNVLALRAVFQLAARVFVCPHTHRYMLLQCQRLGLNFISSCRERGKSWYFGLCLTPPTPTLLNTLGPQLWIIVYVYVTLSVYKTSVCKCVYVLWSIYGFLFIWPLTFGRWFEALPGKQCVILQTRQILYVCASTVAYLLKDIRSPAQAVWL